MTQVSWLEQGAADIPATDDWLSAIEAAHLNNLRFAKRRADWRLGRWTAKMALATYLPSHPRLAEIEIRPAASGAPEVFVANQSARVTISLSHRDGMALSAVAASDVALGCDLEVIETRSDAFVSDYFTDEEQDQIAKAATPQDRACRATLLWSAKESALKMLRIGLRVDTRSLAVTVDPHSSIGQDQEEKWRPLQVRDRGGRVFHGWWQHKVSFLRTLVAAPQPGEPIPLKLPT